MSELFSSLSWARRRAGKSAVGQFALPSGMEDSVRTLDLESNSLNAGGDVELLRFVAKHFYRWPIPTGFVLGALAGWGLSRPGCAFKVRGGDCAWALPGEHVLLGQILWGVAVAISVALMLLVVRRLELPEDVSGNWR